MTSELRDLRLILEDHVSELESAVRRAHRGSVSAYTTAASHLRTVVGTGTGNNLLERVLPGATLHPLEPLTESVLTDIRAGAYVIYIAGTLSLGGPRGTRAILKWKRAATPVRLTAWRKQILMVAREQITLGEFVQKMGDQVGAHADERLRRVVQAVASAGLLIRVDGQRMPLERLYVIAIADYVAKRCRQLLAE